ncbi:MAG: hypothetical protein QNJ88_09490 [Acidimicrobiia bacterium]|nr:hypothetical protein [Acidimicrobiia bacterium]
MQKRSRFTLVVLAVVVALVVSSCWQIRRVRVNKWVITAAETTTVTLDLAKDVPDQDTVGYAFVLVGITSNLRVAGRKWDTLGNFGGFEVGVKDALLKTSLLADEGFCSLGGASLGAAESGYSKWVAFRTSKEIDLSGVAANTILRFKHKLGVAPGATLPDVANFIYITGLWGDDGDLVPEPAETVCQSSYHGTLALAVP